MLQSIPPEVILHELQEVTSEHLVILHDSSVCGFNGIK